MLQSSDFLYTLDIIIANRWLAEKQLKFLQILGAEILPFFHRLNHKASNFLIFKIQLTKEHRFFEFFWDLIQQLEVQNMGSCVIIFDNELFHKYVAINILVETN